MAQRPIVCLTVLPIGKKITTEAESSLLDTLRHAGIEIAAPCNGQGLCGKCKVRITTETSPVKAPHPHLSPDEIAVGTRLACEVDAYDGMKIILPEDHSLDTRILQGERIRQGRVAPAAVVKRIDGHFVLHYQGRPPVVLPDWKESFSPKGIAVDLGTTTLVVSVVDLQTGRDLETASALNPQNAFGHDVMSRIQYSSTKTGLQVLTDTIARGLNGLIEKVCRDAKIQPGEIMDAVIGGNTTMLQLAAAIDPTPLGRLPFAVGIESGCTYSADRFSLKINPQARVYIPPVAHAFVGSDISAGLWSIDFFRSDSNLLFMDLGTNAEMALVTKDKKIVASTAAGPAFEGMGITHGMRAARGAIETVWTDEDYLNLRTIGDAPACGICGSGIIDLMASLIRLEVVEPGGRLKKPHMSDFPKGPFSARYEMIGDTAAIRLTKEVYFTQKDIRQFQLAKSAILTGAEMVLASAGIPASNLERIIISGAFGHYLRKESLRRINILPRGFAGKIEFAGNTSHNGCMLLLSDAGNRHRLEEQMRQVAHLSIAGKPDFQRRFVENVPLQ